MLQPFQFEGASGTPVAIRVIGLTGAQAGDVFDFHSDTFTAIGSATTPYLQATELTGIAGTGQSVYLANLNLALINPTLVPMSYLVAWYLGNPPATTVNPSKLEPVIQVQNGNLGPRNIAVQAELSVKSTVGDAAQLSLWLEDSGVLVPIGSLDSGTTGSIVVRQFLSGTNLFTQNFTAANLINNSFEIEYSPTPGTAIFSDDRQYELSCTITVNGQPFTGKIERCVIG